MGLFFLFPIVVHSQTSATRSISPTDNLRPDVRSTALGRYIAQDPHYSFQKIRSDTSPAGTVHLLELTSQDWRSEAEVNKPAWKHWMFIAIPTEVRGDTAALVIGSGSNAKDAPDSMRSDLIHAAVASRSVVLELRNVPNQPLVFGQDGIARNEDNLIAYSWDRFLRTGDETWLARLPMTKSAVRAMDAVTAFCASKDAGEHSIRKFLVSGASKRGWTTWTTAAVDKRVVGIIPIVIDVLNMQESMLHHYAAYGFWAPAIRDYTQFHIMDWIDTSRFEELKNIEDPFSYRDQLTMPKLILNACGDQFFLPDSSQYYLNELPGDNYLRYVPNTDHSMKNSDFGETWLTFYQALLSGSPLPRYTWSQENGSLTVETIDEATEVKLWQATNPNARDFRLETIGPAWTSSPLKLENGRVKVSLATPEKGWTAYMVELTYQIAGRDTLKLTTSVYVTPDRTDHEFIPESAAVEK